MPQSSITPLQRVKFNWRIGIFLSLSFSFFNPAYADRCPTATSKFILQSANGVWTDSEYILVQKQEWTFIDLDDLTIPVPLPKVQNTTIVTPQTSPTVGIAPSPPPAGQSLSTLFYRLKKNSDTCPLLLLMSTDWKSALSVKFDPNGTALAASRVDMSGIDATTTSLSPENIDAAGNDELIARSEAGLLTAIFSIDAEAKISYDALMTIEFIWADFVEKTASNRAQALKYLTPELETEYLTPTAFATLASIKSLQKDFGVVEVAAASAKIATILTREGRDYLHYVTLEKRAGTWRITGL